MPIDVVCWMHVERNSGYTLEYNGSTYYFCSEKCKEEFERFPDKYLGVKSPMKMPEQSASENQSDPLISLICRRCEFFKEDDVKLECAAFSILKNMLRKGIITQEEIKDAFN